MFEQCRLKGDSILSILSVGVRSVCSPPPTGRGSSSLLTDGWRDGCDRIWSRQVEAAAAAVPTSILVASPPLTMGTVFPEWILYCPIEWPFRFLMGFTGAGTRVNRSGGSTAAGIYSRDTVTLRYPDMFSRRSPPRRTPSPPEWSRQCRTSARQSLRTETCALYFSTRCQCKGRFQCLICLY